LINRKH